ncbi:hypothetical protein M422DRAFT_247377 [Sphaerobolus stellatus SS14]|nr:hypothetical protein M422DRAFT_247377 [Sphaerobolus stellatus SS14]
MDPSCRRVHCAQPLFPAPRRFTYSGPNGPLGQRRAHFLCTATFQGTSLTVAAAHGPPSSLCAPCVPPLSRPRHFTYNGPRGPLGRRGVLPRCGRCSWTPFVAVRTVRSRIFPPPTALPTPGLTTP